MSDLPTGTVTFVFTDIEGSTSMLQRLGDGYVEVLENHHRLIRVAFGGGTEVGSEGDSFFFVFVDAPGAQRAACAAQRALADFVWPEGGSVRVRIGLHTGEGVFGGDNYVGLDVNRAARIAAAGHGGQILASDATRILAAPVLPDDVTLRDLGEHRFRGLEQPERVYQVVLRGLPADFPPIRSLDAAPNNLPSHTTSFVGRSREVAEVIELLGQNRLVTLTGPGGSGKTRLALRVAAQVQADFPDGVFYIPLESLRSADLVVAAIADPVGTIDGMTPEPLEALIGAMAGDTVLLLVDNFEHVLEASPDLAALLAGAGGVKLLVTSQSPLRIRGERIYPVPPLASNEAVDLFAELATAADPSFAIDDKNRGTIEEIVTLLDGMPLALELTAPRIQLFGLKGLRNRLVDRLEIPSASIVDLPERHRTLNDAITWSYDLLSDDDQAVLRQLSVFDGGFTLEAAEAVVTPPDMVVAGVASLLDRSLIRHQVQRGEARFSMLESIRLFAARALEDSGQHDTTAQRHGEYFAELGEASMPLLEGAAQQVWMDRLGDEHDNIRAVLRLSRDSAQPDLGLRTAGSIWRFFHRRGHLLEAHEWLDILLGMPGSSMQARAVGVEGLAGITYWQADYAEAERLYSELVAIYRKLGDEKKVADTLLSLAGTAQWLGDSDRAMELAHDARAAYRRVGDAEGAARVAGLIARSTWQAGHLDEALELWAEARAAYAALGNDGEVRQTDAGIAAVLHQLGRTDDAVILLAQVVEAMVDADDVSGTIMAIDFLAAVAGATNAEPAVRLAGAADSLRAEAGGGLSAESVGLEPARSAGAGSLDGTAIDAAWSQGQALTLEEAVVLSRKVAASGAYSD